MHPHYTYVNTALNAKKITQSLVNIATTTQLQSEDHSVLLALRFHHDILMHADLSEIQIFLQQVNQNSIVALVTQLKRQLKRIHCLQLAHEETVIYAAYLQQSSDHLHVLIQTTSAECFSLNLTITPNTLTSHESLKSTEDTLLAGQHILENLKQETQFPNKALTQSIEDAVDFLVTAKDPNDEHFWAYFPAISIVSVSIAIYQLFQRYQQQQITWQEFQWMAAKISGIKVSKIAAIGLLLGLPMIGQITGAYLIARSLLNAKATWFEKDAALYRYLQHKMKSNL